MGFGAGSAARFALAGVVALFLCWQHVQAVRLGYRVEAQRRLAAEKRDRVAAMRLSLDEDLTPSAVAERAARLGLVPASPDALRRLPARPSSAKLLGLRWNWRFPFSESPRG